MVSFSSARVRSFILLFILSHLSFNASAQSDAITSCNSTSSPWRAGSACLVKDTLGNNAAMLTQPHAMTALVSHYTKTATLVSQATCPHGSNGPLVMPTAVTNSYLFWQCSESFYNTDTYYSTLTNTDSTGWANCTPAGAVSGYTEYCTMNAPVTVLVSHYEYAATSLGVTPVCLSDNATVLNLATASKNIFQHPAYIAYWQCYEKYLITDPYYQSLILSSTAWTDCTAPLAPITAKGYLASPAATTGYSEQCFINPSAYCQKSAPAYAAVSAVPVGLTPGEGTVAPQPPLYATICP